MCPERTPTVTGGDGGIRTLDRALQPYNGLANRRLQPLGHVSDRLDMPDVAASRKHGCSKRIVRFVVHVDMETPEVRASQSRRW